MADNILTIQVTKNFARSEDRDYTYSVCNREDLEQVLGLVRKHYEDYEKPQRETVEKQIWSDILNQTPFETKEEFYDWLGKMRNYYLCCKDFCFEDYNYEIIKTALRDADLYDYDNLDEVKDAIIEMQGALCDIHDLSSNF